MVRCKTVAKNNQNSQYQRKDSFLFSFDSFRSLRADWFESLVYL